MTDVPRWRTTSVTSSTRPPMTGMPVPADPAAAQRLFAERLPVVWLYHPRGVQGMNARVLGVRMDVRGELPTVAAWRVQP